MANTGRQIHIQWLKKNVARISSLNLFKMQMNKEEIYSPFRDNIPVETRNRFYPSPVGTK
jgi:hypothetical protein